MTTKVGFERQQQVGSLDRSAIMQLKPQDERIRKVSLETLRDRQSFLPKGPRHFIILLTGDTHSNIEPTVASFVSPNSMGGCVRRIQYLEQMILRSKAPVLPVDAGDFLQGTGYFEQFEGKPEIQCMDLAGYRVITIGNHDLDKGWEHLKKLLQEGSFDAVCANIFIEGTDISCLAPYVLFDIEETSVAVVGVMGMDSWQSIRPSDRKGLEIKNPMEVLDSCLPEIRSHVDVVILLSHSGIKEDRELAKHPMVDIVLGGHSHTWMTEQELIISSAGHEEKKTPVFHAFRNGMLVGKMEVYLERDKLLSTTASVEYLDEQFDPPLEGLSQLMKESLRLFNGYKEEMEMFNIPLGECIETLPTKDKGLHLVPIGQAIAEAFREVGGAQVGLIPSGSIKVGVEKGVFTLETLHRILAHKESLWTLTCTGKLLKTLMLEGDKRWGNQRTFQYAGIELIRDGAQVMDFRIDGDSIIDDNSYRIAAPSFFFEREFMDQEGVVLPQYSEDIKYIEKRSEDLRDAVARLIQSKGLGVWIKGVD